MIKHTQNFLEITEVDIKQGKIKRRSTKDLSSSSARKERIQVLWSRARQFAKVIGKVNKLKNDIQTFGSNRMTKDIEIESPTTIKRKASYIIMPNSTFKTVWNILIIISSLYIAIIMPFVICFKITFDSMFEIDMTIDCLFIIDIFLSFFSAYTDKSGKTVTSHKKIAVSYLKSWFFIDLLSSLPIEIIDSPHSSKTEDNKFINFLKVGRMYKIIRLIRLLKMLRLLKFNSTQFNFIWITISSIKIQNIIFIAGLLVLIHIFSCLWYFFSDEYKQDSWVNVYNVENLSNFEKYVSSIYFVFTTLTKIGYGDITPQNNEEKIYAIFLMGLGAGIYSYTIGCLSSFVSARDKIKLEVKEKMNGIKEFAKTIKLPQSLFERMKKSIKFSLKNNSHSKLSQFDLLKEIPANLREQVLEHVNKNVVKGLNFFNDKSRVFINRFVPFLKICIFVNKDLVYEEKDIAEELYFMKKGRVHMKAGNDLVFRIYVEGSYFGEIEIFENKPRDCTCCISSPEAELLLMNKKELLKILDEFPSIKDSMIYTARIKKIKYVDSKSKVLDICDIRPDCSLITESESSESSESSEIVNENIYRQDTGVIVSLKYESQIKKKNRRLWTTALEKDPKQSIFHRTKTLMRKNEKRHSYSRYTNFSTPNKPCNFSKKRSHSGEIQRIKENEFKTDFLSWRENTDDYLKKMELDEISFDSNLSVVREETYESKFKVRTENVLVGNKMLAMNIEDIVSFI